MRRMLSVVMAICFGPLAAYAAPGDLEWAKRAGGEWYEAGRSIAALSDGSAVATGQFAEIATFGEGEENETDLISDGGDDIFIARYNADGRLAWARRAGGTGWWDAGWGIAACADDSVVVAGKFEGTASFGQGEGNETKLISAGGTDIFIARYNADGTLAWARRAGGTAGDGGLAIAVASDGAFVVTGYISTTATFGVGEANETDLVSAGRTDIFIARYNPDGTVAWARRAGGTGSDFGEGISTSADSSALVTGYFDGAATFGPGEPGQAVLVSAGSCEIFVARYARADGTLAWARRAGGTASDGGKGISALADGSALVTGDFRGIATFGQGEIHEITLSAAGGDDVFIARYNPGGTLAWAKRAGGRGGDAGTAIVTLGGGSALVTGAFSDTGTFGPGEPGEVRLPSAGDRDIFLARYNADGTLAWVRRAGGGESNWGDDWGSGVAVSTDGHAYLTGYFDMDGATFGPGEPGEVRLPSAGELDIFIAKYDAMLPCHGGDVNGDGQLTPVDANAAFHYYIDCAEYSPTYEEYCAADYCGSGEVHPCDGSVTPGDAWGIMRSYLGYADPCGGKGVGPDAQSSLFMCAAHRIDGKTVEVAVNLGTVGVIEAAGAHFSYNAKEYSFIGSRDGDVVNRGAMIEIGETTPGTLALGIMGPGAIPAGSKGCLTTLRFCAKGKAALPPIVRITDVTDAFHGCSIRYASNR